MEIKGKEGKETQKEAVTPMKGDEVSMICTPYVSLLLKIFGIRLH